MTATPPLRARGPLLRHAAAIAAIVALVAAHGAILQLVAAHASLSLGVVAALGGAIALKHLGLLGLGHGALRRHFRRER
jgi:hypothetical protein